MNEDAVLFGKSGGLVGIVSSTDNTELQNRNIGIVFLNAGVVHRIGQNRLYVKIARSATANGYTCMRFDLSGIGDSLADPSELDFHKRTIAETKDAIDFLQTNYNINRFILAGACSGAVNSIKTAINDPRVESVVLINPSSPPMLRSFIRQYLLSIPSLSKFFKGKANYTTIISNIFKSIKNYATRLCNRLTCNSQNDEESYFITHDEVRLLLDK